VFEMHLEVSDGRVEKIKFEEIKMKDTMKCSYRTSGKIQSLLEYKDCMIQVWLLQ